MKIVFIALLALAVATSAGQKKGKKDHPGCYIFWFLKDCPLSKLAGVDPFGIYPWKK